MVDHASKTPKVGGEGPEDSRSQAIALIAPAQAADMTVRRELISVRVRVATSRANHETLIDHAVVLETKKIAVPDTMKAFIAQASEEHDVAFAIYQSRLNTAAAEKSAAATAHDALREWRACVTVNILHGKNAPELHDLSGKPEAYEPPPPHEPDRTDSYAAWKDPYCAARASLDKKIANWARLLYQVKYHKWRSEPAPEACQALVNAASSVSTAEISMCQLLVTANANVRTGIAEGNVPATVKALRTVNWLQGLPPPTKADFPPGWKPTAVPNSLPAPPAMNSFELLPVDETDYEYESSSQPEGTAAQGHDEADERVQDQRAGKKRREYRDVTDTAHADPSYVDGIVLNCAEEAKMLTAMAKKDVLKAMEAPTETEVDERAAQAAATALATAAIATQTDTCMLQHLENSGTSGVNATVTADLETDMLTKTQRSARDSNSRFFTAVQPRLDGRADPMKCFKCELQECILASKSKGDRAPAFQAQLQGKKCGKTVAPSVCMAYWYGAGTLHDYLPAIQPVDTSSTTPPTKKFAGAVGSDNTVARTPEQQAQADLAERTNATEAALLSLEQAACDAAGMQARIDAKMTAREATFRALVDAHQKRCLEDKKESDSARDILAAINTNISRAQDARVNGTVAALLSIPTQYVSEPPPPPTISNTHSPHQITMNDSTAPSTYALAWGPGMLSSPAFPGISRVGPQVPPGSSTAGPQAPARPFDRAEIRMTYSRALASKPRPPSQQRITARRNRDVDEVGFILLTNFDHQAISRTKLEFSEHLEVGTDILHYRRMPLQGLELALPKYQVSMVSIQLRQMGYRIAPNYLPSNPMTRRRPGETESQGRDRAAYCAHRAMAKIAGDPRANTAVSDWFARACDRMAAAYPHVFTDNAREKWNATMAQESLAKRAAEASQPSMNVPDKTAQDNPTTPDPASTIPAKPVAPATVEVPDMAPSTPTAPEVVADTLSQARDNRVPGAK